MALLLCMPDASATNESVQKADSLAVAARNAYSQNFTRSIALALASKKLSVNNNYAEGIIAAQCIISQLQSNTNHCQGAIDSLNKLPDNNAPAVQAMIYSAKGVCLLNQGSYDSAIRYHSKALQLWGTCNRPDKFARECIFLAKAYIKTGRREQALGYYEKAKSIFDKTADGEGVASTKALIGEIFYAQRLYDKALVYLAQGYVHFQRLGHISGAASTRLQMGNVYYMQVKDDSANDCYTGALKQFTALGDSSGMAICYSNLSRLLLDGGKPVQAIAYAQKALGVIRPGNYMSLEAGTYQQLGDIYGELEQYDKAAAYVQKAIIIARMGNNKVIVRDCYKSLSEIYEAAHKPQLALENLRAAYRIKDSIEPVTFSKQLAEMEAKYEAEKKETEIRLLKQQGQINALKMQQQGSRLQKQGYLLLLLIVVIVALLLTVYFYLARRKLLEQVRQQNIIRETEEKERLRIAKDIHDELGSGLSKIRFLSELAYTQPEGGRQLSGSLGSIADTSKGLIENMRDLVWAMNPENTTLGNLVARIREYSYEYLEEFPIGLQFNFPEEVADRRITKEISRNVYMIVKESLQNIVKHSGATKVIIGIAISNIFKLEIRDNGKGYDPALQTEGNGLKNMTSRSRALGAALQITSLPGTGSVIELQFRLDEPA